MCPPSSDTLSSIFFAKAFTRRGSSPMTNFSSSRTAASVVRMNPFSVPSPIP